MELIDMMRNRRSVRDYTQEEIPEEKIKKVLQAGLLSASGRARRPWEFILVRDKTVLRKMAGCREGAAKMLEKADAAIVVVANPKLTDVWVEDCSIAMANMHLMADSLGIGSCWIQGRLRTASDGRTAEEFLRELLGFPDSYRLEAILSMGTAKEHPKGYSLDKLLQEKIHVESYRSTEADG